MTLDQFLGGMSPDVFLQTIWEKKPLLIRNAVKDADTFINKAQFFQHLTENDTAECRIVMERGGSYPWEVCHSPLDETDIQHLPESYCTVLAQGMNRYFKPFHSLEKLVEFIPKWKFDDVMVSYAKDMGSVGAHTDRYSVFIVQGAGSRTWKLQLNPTQTFQEDLDIKQLVHFQPDIEWTLHSGDMIYLPPEVAHHGLSHGESFSYSIGFRSLDFHELIQGYAHHKIETIQDHGFFKESLNSVISNPHVISNTTLTKLATHIASAFKDTDEIKQWIATYLSEPKEEPLFVDDVPESYTHFRVSEHLRFFISESPLMLHVAGLKFSVSPSTVDVVTTLFTSQPNEVVHYTGRSEEVVHIISTLCEYGFLIPRRS